VIFLAFLHPRNYPEIPPSSPKKVNTFTHPALSKEIKMKYTALLLGCLIVIATSPLQGMSQWDTRTGARVPQLVAAPLNILKVGFQESSAIVCWEILGTYYVDCCGIPQASLFMLKGTGDWSPERHVEQCCEWVAAVECIPL
jgi:hypothetical protein